MNRKILLTVLALAVVLLATPLVQAVPGEEKNNEKFLPFELKLWGSADPTTGEQWQTGPDPANPETVHVRDRDWVATDLKLTVGSEVYTFTSDPVYVEYSGTVDIDTNIRTIEEGNANVQHVRVTETITFYDEDGVIGALELDVRSMIVYQGDFPPNIPRISGTFVAHGTGALEGVQVTGIDTIIGPPLTILRAGQAMNWPDLA